MDQHLFLQALAGLGLLFASVLQYAVYCAPDAAAEDRKAKQSARRLMILALTCLGMYLLWSAINGRSIDNPVVMFTGLIGVAQTVSALARLFPGMFHEHN